MKTTASSKQENIYKRKGLPKHHAQVIITLTLVSVTVCVCWRVQFVADYVNSTRINLIKVTILAQVNIFSTFKAYYYYLIIDLMLLGIVY